MSASNSAVPEPTHIGRYEIVAKLGAGAFGTVYKAKDPELDRFVAIKTIRLEGLAASQASLDDLISRFKREARVAAKLKHPNIVGIFDTGSIPGNSYVVMEFIDGVGLDRVIKGSGKMAVERAAAIGIQVAEALDYAWRSEKLVHRDIKPANIMIEPGDHVKVTDFGIAKLMTGDTVDHLTATGSLLGTPSYMSPEQARGQELDGQSDLFSLGCILYEMVAGQRAFRGDSITALLFKIVTEDPPSLRQLDPTVSDEMLRIIGKALSKAPETRYKTGRELAHDLMALTRPGFVPTMRAYETPTLPPDAPPGDVPTLQSAGTFQSPPTVSGQPTAVSGGAAVAPTIVTPTQGGPPAAPTVPPKLPPKAPPPPAARAARPQASEPVRRRGGGAGLVIGLGIAGVLLFGALAVGGFILWQRSADAPPDTTTAEATPLPSEAPSATPPPSTSSSSTLPAEAPPTEVSTPATTQPASRTASVTPPPSTTVAATPPATTRSTTGPTTTARGAATQPPPTEYVPPAGDAFAHLDELPAEETDGRAAGEAVAQKYRSGGGTSYTNTRFRERPKVPRGVTLQERPAVATLFYIHTVQQAYQRSNGRYGTLQQLKDSGLLALDVPLEPQGFKRQRYQFRVAVEPDGFRAEAVPLAPVGRSFIVDDTGKVRLADE